MARAAFLLISCTIMGAHASPPGDTLLRQWYDVVAGHDDDLTHGDLTNFFVQQGAVHRGGELAEAAVHRLANGAFDEGGGGLTFEAFLQSGLLPPGVEAALAGPGHAGGPEQVHVALTDDPSALRVTWASLGSADEDAATAALFVWPNDGANATTAARVLPATSTNYSVPSRWWQPRGWVGLVHSAVVPGLAPGGGTHSILPSVNGRNLSTGPLVVRAPLPATQKEITFAAFGDMGTVMPLGFKVSAKIQENLAGLDFVFQHGDISYAGVDTELKILNISKNDEWEFIWDLFGRQIQPIASNIPWLVGVGNHEAWYNWTAYRSRYPMPSGPQAGAVPPFWYSFRVGNVHICSGSSEHDYSIDSPQIAWIAADLARAAADDSIEWIIFSVHRPLICSDTDGWSNHRPGSRMLTAFEPHLGHVDLVLTGHEHCYERVHPNRNGTVVSLPNNATGVPTYENPTAPVQVVVGSAGAMQVELWKKPTPAWSAVRFADGVENKLEDDGNSSRAKATAGSWHYENSYGYGKISVEGATKLTYEFVSIRDESPLKDTFVITK